MVWDPWKNGATKIYAFAGRFSYALPTAAAALSFANASGSSRPTTSIRSASTQDPGVIGHERASVRYRRLRRPGRPGRRAWYQDELTVGIERLLGPTLTVGLKGTYRTLRNVLEDRCDLDYNSPETDFSLCGLMNPGSSGEIRERRRSDVQRPRRRLARVRHRPGPRDASCRAGSTGASSSSRASRSATSLWLQASYVYSSLRGNYDGGVNQGSYGQTCPGHQQRLRLSRSCWHNGYGILALDRPNRFRFDGYWVTPWRLSVGLQAFAESGAPLNRLGYFNEGYGSDVFLVPRGSEGRLPTFWGTNLTLSYPIAIGPATVTLQAYLFNVFNKQIAISRDDAWSDQQPPDYPASIFDPEPGAEQPRLRQGHRPLRSARLPRRGSGLVLSARGSRLGEGVAGLSRIRCVTAECESVSPSRPIRA